MGEMFCRETQCTYLFLSPAEPFLAVTAKWRHLIFSQGQECSNSKGWELAWRNEAPCKTQFCALHSYAIDPEDQQFFL